MLGKFESSIGSLLSLGSVLEGADADVIFGRFASSSCCFFQLNAS